MNESRPSPLFSIALQSHRSGRLADAKAGYERVLQGNPAHADALHHLGIIYLQGGEFNRAVTLIEHSLKRNPRQPRALSNLGHALGKLGRHREAVKACSRSLQQRPDSAEALANRGNAYLELGDLKAAERDCRRALEINPENFEYVYNLGRVLLERGEYGLAASHFGIAAQMAPTIPEIRQNHGVTLQKQGRHADAIAHFDAAISLRPDYAQAWSNRGNSLGELRRFQEALASFERAVAIDPDRAEVWVNRADTLRELGCGGEAVASYDRALALKPGYTDAWAGRGDALRDLGRPDDALDSYRRAFELNPDLEHLAGDYLYAKMQLCDWTGFDDHVRSLRRKIERGERATQPFPVLALYDDPALQRMAAETYVRDKHPARELAVPRRHAEPGRIRVGYYSADFREHPVAHLIVGLIEAHDRTRFEIVGFSLDSCPHDAMRERLAGAFDCFIDVGGKSDAEIAGLSREMGIDIAVDLGGHTQKSRFGIFALRCAPVQVSYLGYLGTSGAGYVDYLIADRTLVQESDLGFYSEKILHLPFYQANDAKRPYPARTFARAELGLPERGFVFCCFNNSYKVVPRMFDSWMRILKKVPGSVLLLYAENERIRENLTREAGARGISADRLVFGARLPRADYLARYRCADLFLDTMPYNAGTTASDALWMGLPVLTCRGKTFAGRMAASLLTALGLPQLVAESLDSYERLAVELATDTARLDGLRQALAHGRTTAPMFDPKAFAANIEAAFLRVLEAAQVARQVEADVPAT